MNYGLSRTKRMDLVSAEERFFYDRLLRQEADHRLANLLQIVSGNLTRSCRDGSTEQARRLIGAAADQIVALGSSTKRWRNQARCGPRMAAPDCRFFAAVLRNS